jgi:hypothetical protein
MGVLMRAKATSQIMTLAHRCGVCNERLFNTRPGGGEWSREFGSKVFIFLSRNPLWA